MEGLTYGWGFFVDDVEDRDMYFPGGLHPIHIGDILNNRYKILHKLGYGGSSTVWLARDHALQVYVAVKVFVAEKGTSENSRTNNQPTETSRVPHELGILQYIHTQLKHSTHPGKDHVPSLPRLFYLDGPNGKHSCFVYELFMPQSWTDCVGPKVAPELAKRAALQVTQAIAFIHSIRSSHGDVKPGNVVCKIDHEKINALSEEAIYERLGNPCTEEMILYSRDEKRELVAEPNLPISAPRYVVERLSRKFDWGDVLLRDVSIIDFGEAKLQQQSSDDPDKNDDETRYTLMYALPELVRYDGRLSFSGYLANDIWGLACTVFYLRSARHLFNSLRGTAQSVKRQWRSRLGDLPQDIDANVGEPLNEPWEFEVEGDGVISNSLIAVIRHIGIEYTFHGRELVVKDDSNAISVAEANLLHDLLSRMLRYNPEERISVERVLTHPWFS